MASGPTAQLKTTGVTRARGESDQSYNARVSAYNKAQAKAAADAKTTSDASAAASKQKLDALIASKYPKGLPSWVAANGLIPSLTTDPNRMVFIKETPEGKTYYGEQGEFRSQTTYASQGLDPFAIIGGLALSFFLPGVGSAIAESLIAEGIVTSQVAANIIGSVVANTAASVAQGNSFDDALKNSLVSAAVSTGSVEVAKEVNKFVTSKAVTDAIVSAGASAVKTAATGGTEQDVINNMTGALAGSAASSAYQLGGEDYTRQTGRVIGSAVAGYVTGGGAGAVTSAVGELGSQSKGKIAGTIEDVKDSLKGTTDTKALPASQVEALNPPTDAGAASGANALNKVDVTSKALAPDITSTNIIDTVARTTPATPPPPGVTAPPKLENVEVSGKALPKATDITETDILDTIAKEKKADAELKRVEISGKKEEPLALETKTITGKADSTLPLVNISGKADKPAATPEKELVPEEKPYDPNLFILSGKKPKSPTTAPKTSTSALSQALGTTTGLTASRGAGEIEDPSTGKKRKKVWNEETLRLKDALGV